VNRRRLTLLAALVAMVGIASSVEVRAAGIEAHAAGFRRAGTALRVAFEIRDVVTDRFRRIIEQGGTLYVRIESELWESRSVWDRLVRPAAVSVARVSSETASRSLVLVDCFGAATVYPPDSRAVTVWADLVPVERVDDTRTYYVHATVTVGTIAENEINGVSEALFGADRQSSSLGSLGKFVFQKVLRLADYLDSISCDVTSGRTPGRQMKIDRK
jgi:hypothetical protein